MAKPTVKTPENQELILDAIRRGGSFTIAAGVAGIHPGTLYEWKAENQEFRDAIKKARSECAMARLDKITDSEQWQAHAWWLERQFPEDFTLVQKIEQVLSKHGLIAPGVASQLEDGGTERPAEPVEE